MDSESCCNHGPAWVVKIKFPAQVDAPLPVGIDGVIVLVAKSVGRNSKVVIFPADSLRVRVHAKQVERKPIATIAIEPKNTVKVVLEPQTAGERLFKPYRFFVAAIVYGQ